jgi:hypothetical protein
MYIGFLLLAGMLSGFAQSRLIERAAFFQGCWERRAGNRIVEEQWMKPRGGMMLGTSRTVRADTVVEYEFMRLFERNGALVYAAQPSGQAPAEFTSTDVADGAITFSNPRHDFPQRVIYRAAGDSLHARIEGTMNGRERGVDFRYARVRCV